MPEPVDDNALSFRTRQVAALRGLLAQRSAELDEARSELEAARTALGAAERELARVREDAPTGPAPRRRKRR